MKSRIMLAAVASLAVASVGSAQPRGIELFGALASGQMVKLSGIAPVRWLPPSIGGYLVVVRDSTATGPVTRFTRVDPVTGKSTPVFDAKTTARIGAEYRRLNPAAKAGLPFDDFAFDAPGKFLSFSAGTDRYVYEVASGAMRKLRMPDKVGPLDEATPEAGTFSPDFRYYAFIRDYDNLYLFDTQTGAEEKLVTGTSENNLIGFLGVGSWYVWSPDSKRIAYVTADQRGLYKYPILQDLTPHATVDLMRYPFTVDSNPTLRIHAIDVATKKSVDFATSTEEDSYFRDIVWLADGSEVTFQVVNRWENRRVLKAGNPTTGALRTVLVDEVTTFLDPIHNFREVAGGKQFLWSSEKSGYRHIYLHDRAGAEVRQLTSGDWVTNDVVGVDEAQGWVYFQGATNYGLEQHLFRVKLDGTGLARITPDTGVHRLSMDPGAHYFTDIAMSLKSPPTMTLRAGDGRSLRVLGSSDASAVAQVGLRAPELLTLVAADGVTPMHGMLWTPADFDPSKKYPLIVSVYGGPHTKAVRNSYATTELNAAIAQLGFLVAEFDGRGTIDRGKKWAAGNYLHLGQEDVDDQAAGVKQLRSRPYFDSTRVGVTGISHGGYMTMAMMLRYPDVYQVGAAGAPMTDLSNGPRQYIGRFMRTPQGNPEGYAKADLLPRAKDLKGRLLIFHGTNDRNAVIGNTMQFVRKAIDAGRPVDMMIYPNGVHVLEGADGIHGMKTTLSYFLEHLRPEKWEQTRAALWQ